MSSSDAPLPPPRFALPIGSGQRLYIDRIDSGGVLAHVFAALDANHGGHIVTPNVDILAQVRRNSEARELVESADLVVADGAPLVWASRLARQPLPERVAGSDLIWSMCEVAAAEGRRVGLLGGTPDPQAAVGEEAVTVLQNRNPGLKIVGAWSPAIGFDLDAEQWDRLATAMRDADPEIIFVGMGFPKQERIIARLRTELPHAWMLGCGASIDFVAGYRKRAPAWMQRSGTEWLYRMCSEPRRLLARYLVVGIPQALRLLAGAFRLRRINQD